MTTRHTRKVIAAQQRRAARILAKVQRLGFIDASKVKTPKQLISAMQQEAERLHREGALRADELKDLKALHALQLQQIAEQEIKARKEAAGRMKL